MTRGLMLLLLAIDTLGIILAFAVYLAVDKKMLALIPIVACTLIVGVLLVIKGRKSRP